MIGRWRVFRQQGGELGSVLNRTKSGQLPESSVQIRLPQGAQGNIGRAQSLRLNPVFPEVNLT
jgi:hypothetical protein